METYNWGFLDAGFIVLKTDEVLSFIPQSGLYAVGLRNIESAKSFVRE